MKLFPKTFAKTCPKTCPRRLQVLAALALSAFASAPAPAQGVSQGVSRKAGLRLGLGRPLRAGAAGAPSFIERGEQGAARLAALSSVREQAPQQEAAGGPLSFVVSGFTAQQTKDINAFIGSAYPKMVAVYGQPSPLQQGRTVSIVSSTEGGDGRYQYDPGLPGFNTIEYEPYLAGSFQSYFANQSGCGSDCQANTVRLAREFNNFYIARQMLLAFRGPQLTAFDAWDNGHADAAALIVAWQVLGQPSSFDPLLYSGGVSYSLPNYDFLNRPQLSNKYFYSPNKGGTTASSYALTNVRYGMAQAAWLKVWVENPSFFARFNARYYASNPAVTGQSAASLSAIAGSIAPTVEGLSWNDWLRRQYILDTSIHTGEHLFAWIHSFSSYAPDNLPSSFLAQLYHFSTDAQGNEHPLLGGGAVRAFDESGRDITSLSPQLRADSRLAFSGAGEGVVSSAAPDQLNYVSFDPTGQPDQARVTLRFQAGGAQDAGFYAHNVVGNTAQVNGFYGVITGTSRGRFALQANSLSTTGAVERGAWLSASTYPAGASVKALFRLTPSDGGGFKLFRRNTAWSFDQILNVPSGVGFVFETPPSSASITASWTVRNANRWRLISVPVTPFESDEARALAIAPASLVLARPVPALRARADLSRGFPFGITSARNIFYPQSSKLEPLGPGRAYWLKLSGDKTVTIRGGEPERAFPVEVALQAGWNAVGVPFELPFSLASLQVRVGQEALGWNEAVARGWVASGVWKWKPEGGYARADASGGLLVPLEGYFLFVRQARATLIFDPSNRTASLSSSAEGSQAWRVGLSVASGSGASYAREDGFAFGSTTFSGPAPARRAAARPPAGERSVLLAFLSSGSSAEDASGAGNESGWAESFVPGLTRAGARWSFIVDGAKIGERVVLSWGDLSSVPAGFKLFLVDDTAQARLEMSPGGPHFLAWIAQPGARRLHIEAVAQPNSTRAS